MATTHIFIRRMFRPERLCALTDGVYAIVLTLLVLDLKSPEKPESLSDELIGLIPNFSAYLISFLVLAYFWLYHHAFFASVTRCDERTIVGNLGHLLLVSVTPFSASLIGRYGDGPQAVIVLSVLLGLTSWTGTSLVLYVTKHEDWLATDAEGTWVPLSGVGRILGLIVAAASILVSFVNAQVALALWLVLPLRALVLLRRSS